MKRGAISITVFLVFALIVVTYGAQEGAEMALINGKIYTVDDANPWAEAVAVRDGKIIAIGSNSDIQRYLDPQTHVLDVEGKLVIPGLIDSHCHFASGGRSLRELNVSRILTIEALQERLAEKVREVEEGTPIFGVGSFPNTTLFPGLGWPTKEILDEVSPDNPVVINRGGGHAIWVNSRALEISGITAETEVPYGGEIVKDPGTGEPTGILKEAAMSLLRVSRPYTPREDIERALEYAARIGITGICTSSNQRELEIFQQLAEEGKLTLRVYAWLPVGSMNYCIEEGIRQGQGNDMVRIGFLKVFLDGTIGVRSALMFEPFTEEPGNTGLAQYEEEEFYALVEKAHQNGLQIGVHAIGDRAVHWVLNGVERAQEKHGKKDLRHRVEHNTVNIMDDIPRFAELGVIASMQPNITGGQPYRETRLGKERAHRVDMWRTLLENGAILCWGTDWPVSDLNPIQNLIQIVTRYPEQRLTMAEAIRYYTYGPAYASFQEEIKGTLEVGKLADMVVFSKDLLSVWPYELMSTEVLYTIVGGNVVYSNNDQQ